MQKAITIELGGYFKNFVERQVAAGRYDSPGAVLQAGLRLLEEQEAKLHALQMALDEGERSGFSPVPFDLDEFLEDMRTKPIPSK